MPALCFDRVRLAQEHARFGREFEPLRKRYRYPGHGPAEGGKHRFQSLQIRQCECRDIGAHAHLRRAVVDPLDNAQSKHLIALSGVLPPESRTRRGFRNPKARYRRSPGAIGEPWLDCHRWHCARRKFAGSRECETRRSPQICTARTDGHGRERSHPSRQRWSTDPRTAPRLLRRCFPRHESAHRPRCWLKVPVEGSPPPACGRASGARSRR